MSLQFFKNYNILCKIGEGSFSEVLKVQAWKGGKVYAAKRLKKIYKDDPLPGHITLIYELMDMSLYEYLKSRKRCPSEVKVRLFFYQLVCGVNHLHSNGIFHRDIKPENILLKLHSKRRFGLIKTELLKIADMGSACNIYKSPPHTAYISTRWYRAPECLLSHGHYGPKMDIWSLGCVFYEMLTLLPLFPGDNELDQLYRIHEILGTPTSSMLARFKNRNLAYKFPKRKAIGLHKILPAISENGVDILSKCLIYLPEARMDVSKLVAHLYFRDLRTSSSEFHSMPSLTFYPTRRASLQQQTSRVNAIKIQNSNNSLNPKCLKLSSSTTRSSLDSNFYSMTSIETITKQKERIWGMCPGEAKTALIRTINFSQKRKI